MDGEIVVTECRSCQSLRPWWFPPITPPIRAPEPRFSPSTPVENVKSWGCYLVGVFCNEELSDLSGAEPSDGAVPGRETKGPTKQFEKPDGDITKANEDFDKAKPSGVSDKGNGIRVGTLPDGRTIIVRPKSTDGRPTVEVRRPNGRGYEVRYGPRR